LGVLGRGWVGGGIRGVFEGEFCLGMKMKMLIYRHELQVLALGISLLRDTEPFIIPA